MKDTEVIPVREVIARYIGGGWGSETRTEDFSEPAWVIRGTDFSSVQVGDMSTCPHRYHKPSNLISRRLQDGDLIVEVSGGSKDQPVGRALLVDAMTLGQFDGDVIPASFCKLVRPNRALVDPEYLIAFLRWLYASREIMQYQVQSTGISNFQFETFLDGQLMSLPSLPTQGKIAAILTAYDDLIENNIRRIKTLDEMAQRTYREWFVDFRYPGHEEVPLVDSELGVIPEGWSVRRLDEVADVARGLSWDRGEEVTTGGHPVVTIPNVQRRLQLDGMTRLDGLTETVVEKYSLNDGDTLLVGSNGNPERVGHAVSVPCGVEVLFASFLMRVRSDNTLLGSALLHFQLKDPRLTSAWRSSAIGSTSLRNIRLSTLRASPVLIPPSGIRADGDAQLRECLDYKDALDRQATLLAVTRDLLLPRLISGAIDLGDADVSRPELAA